MNTEGKPVIKGKGYPFNDSPSLYHGYLMERIH